MGRGDAVAVHGGGDADAHREHLVARHLGLGERIAQALEDRRAPLGGRVRRLELDAMMHEGPVEGIGDGDGEVGVSRIHPDHDAEVRGQHEAARGAPCAVGAGRAGVRELAQHVGADEGVDRIDRGRAGEGGARHRLGRGELAGRPGEVEDGADARAPCSQVCGDFCHGT